VAQSANPVGYHVEIAVSLNHHQIKAVQKTEHKKGQQKAQHKTQEGSVFLDPKG
jgi:hypothetical protein